MAGGVKQERAAVVGRPARKTTAAAASVGRPYFSLVLSFVVWKVFLLAIAAAASYAGPAYDTSASLANGSYAASNDHDLVTRLSSWDAIYFVQIARRGYTFEQEWAFGSGLPNLVASLHRGLVSLGIGSNISVPALAIGVAHVSHLLSVLALYRLGQLVWLGDAGRRIAFTAASLHILSPAGLFLSAPYAESTFSFLSFAGHLVFAAGSLRDETAALPSFSGDVLRLLAGVLYGLASTFRTNGLLNGVPFAFEALMAVICMARQPSLQVLRRLCFVGLGGLAVAAGTIVPQTVAYLQYCSKPSGVPNETFRPWCLRTVPSIYGFVQEHYWNTGLFRYWTLSNIPLFLLAAPMLSILSWSTKDIWFDIAVSRSAQVKGKCPSLNSYSDGSDVQPKLADFVCCLATSQLLIAGLALTSYHVQIITRLSSGYPVWYWWLARNLTGGKRTQENIAGKIVWFMVMYASIQGVLFASFLPPA